jgi:hypothetical protein
MLPTARQKAAIPSATERRQPLRSQRANGDLERVEGSLVYVIVPQQINPNLATGSL